MLFRYCARPPIAMPCLQRLAGGRLLYEFKRPWRDRTTHIVFGPQEMLAKLAALVLKREGTFLIGTNPFDIP